MANIDSAPLHLHLMYRFTPRLFSRYFACRIVATTICSQIGAKGFFGAVPLDHLCRFLLRWLLIITPGELPIAVTVKANGEICQTETARRKKHQL